VTSGIKLRAGDWVEVLSQQEILATLDRKGALDGMRFMPEMFEYCGRRLRVASSAHKSCDTINMAGGLRVEDAFHLDGVRCTGKDFDGCGAACLVYWKGAWLKPADGPAASVAAARPASNGHPAATAGGCTVADVVAATRAPTPPGETTTYACQTTELLNASKPLPWWDVRQYIEDYRSGNVGLGRIAQGAAYAIPAAVIRKAKHRPRVEAKLIAIYDRVVSLWGGAPFPRKRGTVPPGEKTPPVKLDLQAGELVRIKSYDEIRATLDQDFRNRGLRFDAEQVPFCGGDYRVHSRVSRIIDEKSGKMLDFKNPCLILEGVACESRYSDRRMHCPRAIYSYWREAWVERVPEQAQSGAAKAIPTASRQPAGDVAR
jgi:hypothetical protein